MDSNKIYLVCKENGEFICFHDFLEEVESWNGETLYKFKDTTYRLISATYSAVDDTCRLIVEEV
jgi:hypothetical protein